MKFFQEPLIKYLWSNIFILVCPEVSVSHLRRIRSEQENGEMKFDRFWSDVRKLEIKLNVKLLPEISRHYNNTVVFSKQEK